MKFRGKITDIGSIRQFSKVVGTMSKLTKSCSLRITPDKLYFILSSQVMNGNIRIWCEVAQNVLFQDWSMEGIDKETANEIYLELVTDNLHKALKTAHMAAKTLKMKLTKKHTPCLTLELELPSLASSSRFVLHDVPVNVVPRRMWKEYEEPELPDFDVSLYMPPLKVVKNILDRMKSLCNFLVISAKQEGEMVMKIDADLVNVSTHFYGLETPKWTYSDSQSIKSQQPASQFSEARVDIRKLSQFVSGQQTNPSRIICNIVEKRIVHLYIIEEDVHLQYFIPAVAI